MERKFVRVGLIVMVLAVAGFIMGEISERGDTVAFTIVLLAATLAVAGITKVFGPVQKADERAVKRSEEAALTAVRVSMFAGAIGSAYAKLLGFPVEAQAFAIGMVIPAIIWFFVYWVLNWRDVAW